MFKRPSVLYDRLRGEISMCGVKRWTLDLPEGGSLDLGAVGLRGVRELNAASIRIAPPGISKNAIDGIARRGMLIHRISVLGEVWLIAVCNYLGAEPEATRKFIFHPLRGPHRANFERFVQEFRVDKLWFVDGALLAWFRSDGFFSEFSSMCRQLDAGEFAPIWQVPMTGGPRTTSEGPRPRSTSHAVLGLKVAIALTILIASVALLR